MRLIAALITVPLLTGCLPRQVVVHDGIRASVVDAESKAAIGGAFVYDGFEAGRPRVLARSGADGRLELAPKTRRRMTPVMGEAQVVQSLWICSVGYAPRRVAQRAGWNADFTAARVHALGTVELMPSTARDEEGCALTRVMPPGRAVDGTPPAP